MSVRARGCRVAPTNSPEVPRARCQAGSGTLGLSCFCLSCPVALGVWILLMALLPRPHTLADVQLPFLFLHKLRKSKEGPVTAVGARLCAEAESRCELACAHLEGVADGRAGGRVLTHLSWGR